MGHGKTSVRAAAAVAVAWVLCLSAAESRGQSDAGGLFGPWSDRSQKFEDNTEAAVFNEGHTRGSDYRLQLGTYESQGRYRFLNTYPINPTLGYDLYYLNIHTNDPRLPRKEWDASVAFGSPLAKFADNWFVAASVGGGYAGDVPFSQGDAWYGKATVLVGKEIDKDTKLIFGLDYNGNRTIFPDVPVPGFVFTKRLDPTLILAAGFPYSSVEWTPTFAPALTFNAAYTFPQSVDASVNYTLLDTPWKLFAKFENVLRAFRSSELSGENRLIFQQRRVEAGVRWEPRKFVAFTAAAGFAFSQEFDSGFDTRRMHRIATPSDEPYLRFALEIRP